jgi:DNA-binding MarR family transcriptional regulator
MVVRLTAKGRRRIEEAFPLRHRDAEVGMSALSSAEREQFISLLLRVSAAFDNDQ